MPLATTGTVVLAALGDVVELPRFQNGSWQGLFWGARDAANGLQLGDLVQVDELIERVAADATPALIASYTLPSAPPIWDGFSLLPRTHNLGYVIRLRLLSALTGGRTIRLPYAVQKIA